MEEETHESGDDTLDGEDSTDLRSTWRSRKNKGAPKNAYLTALTGNSVGDTYHIGSGRLFVGRADDCDIVLNDDGVSRRHALIVATPDGKVEIEDLHSTNGTSVNGTLCDIRVLRGGEHVQFGSETVFKFEFRDAIEEQYVTELYESATQDRLTGVFNDHYFREQLRGEFAWHKRHQLPLSLIFLDIDHFKSVNDQYGHLAGDEVLKLVARRCHGEIRTEDIFARYGGEEFSCLLRQTTLTAACAVAESMRQAVENTPFATKGDDGELAIAITISAGVAQMHGRTTEPNTLLEAADRMLYQAKKAGRNRVAPVLKTATTVSSNPTAGIARPSRPAVATAKQ